MNRCYDTRMIDPTASRWAEDEEMNAKSVKVSMSSIQSIPAAGLPIKTGGKSAWVLAGEGHSVIFGSSGSAKTRRLILPMLLTMALESKRSVIMTDPKGELFQATSGLFSKMGYEINVLNFRDPLHTDGWSILDAAMRAGKDSTRQSEIIDDVAVKLFSADQKNDRFWTDSSRALFRAICGLIVKYPDTFPLHMKTITALAETLDDDTNITVADLANRYLPEGNPLRSQFAAALSGSEKTTSNVLVSFMSELTSKLGGEAMMDMLSQDSVRFDALGMKRTALFIICPDEKSNMNELVSLVVSQCYSELIWCAQKFGGELPIPVDFVLDEFGNLDLPDITSMLCAGRSRGIRFHLVAQGMHQLTGRLGDDTMHTILGNCSNLVYLNSREIPLLEYLSALCGKSSRGEALVTPSRLQHLALGQALILTGRSFPYVTDLVDVSMFTALLLPPIPLPVLVPKSFNFNMRQIERKLRAAHDKSNSDHDLDSDLQAMLEARFDAIFGSDNDTDNAASA